ncbi:phosphohistidine phosphatase SixA [Endozoicomonas sp. Mp262]|uniref:phosphohistidine phosphatase SixA n=1 Tax=Endozoicomonas sp. Mp262 TaxID=2919499 RepID=UPI0021DACF27
MKLIIMRHGQAGLNAPSDAERPLTEQGRQQAASTAKKLQHLCPATRVLASPYLRAQQTGSIVAETMSLPLETLDAIVPEGNPFAVIEVLPDSGVILLASHMPLVSALTGLLCEGSVNHGPSFSTGSAVVLEMPAPGIGTATLLHSI